MPQQEDPLDGVAGGQHDVRRQRRAGVQSIAAGVAEMVGQHQTAARIEAFAAVAGPVLGFVGATGEGEKRRAAAESAGVVALGAQ